MIAVHGHPVGSLGATVLTHAGRRMPVRPNWTLASHAMTGCGVRCAQSEFVTLKRL
jgi:hypothetical protein